MLQDSRFHNYCGIKIVSSLVNNEHAQYKRGVAVASTASPKIYDLYKMAVLWTNVKKKQYYSIQHTLKMNSVMRTKPTTQINPFTAAFIERSTLYCSVIVDSEVSYDFMTD